MARLPSAPQGEHGTATRARPLAGARLSASRGSRPPPNGRAILRVRFVPACGRRGRWRTGTMSDETLIGGALDAQMAAAVEHHQAGRLVEAKAGYDAVL